jgi:hypothetical protein
MDSLPESKPLSETTEEIKDEARKLREAERELRETPLSPVVIPPIDDRQFGNKQGRIGRLLSRLMRRAR